LVDTLAFIIWNLAPRSPLQVARDIGRGFRHPGTLLSGALRVIVGLVLLGGSVSILLPLLLPERALVALVTWTALTGLLVDQVAGIDVYGRGSGPGPADR
jgi:hypothetical protein